MTTIFDLRQSAYASMNQLIELKAAKSNIHKTKARYMAYYWLAAQMKIELDFCEIELFNEDQCKRVVSICSDHLPKPQTFWAHYAAVKNRRYA